jgi:hypothetical protein
VIARNLQAHIPRDVLYERDAIVCVHLLTAAIEPQRT